MDDSDVTDSESENQIDNDSNTDSEEQASVEDGAVDLLEDALRTEQIVQNILEISPEGLVDEFEELINPLYQDISAMFADGVPFFIDADSLMLMVMADKQWCPDMKGASLHLVYLIENFLNIFIERGGEFHIIFFETWINIWQQFTSINGTILLYRQVLIEHFKNNTPYNVHLLNNCLEKEFDNLISIFRPQFILTNFDIHNHASIFDIKVVQNVRQMIVRQILSCLSLDLPCVDSNNIDAEIFNVQAFYTVGSLDILRLVKHMRKSFEEYFQQSVSLKNIDDVKVPELNINDPRTLIILLAAKRYKTELYSNDTHVDNILKMFILSHVVMESLNLENRGCPLLKNTVNLSSLLSYVNGWHSCLYEAICTVSNISNVNIKWEMISDLWQGLLFGHLCRFLQNEIENGIDLGITVSKKYELLIEKLKILDVEINPYPISSSFLDVQFGEDYEPKEVTLGESQLLRIQNPLVLEYCASILHQVKWTEPPPQLKYQREYIEEHHYHSMKLLTDEHDRIKNTVATMPVDNWEKKRYMRNIANHARYMTIYGSSIEGRQLTTESVVRNYPKDDNKKEKKAKTSKKAQAIIDRNNKKKLLEQKDSEMKLLKDFENEYKKSDKKLNNLLNQLNILINKFKVPPVCVEANMWKIKILLKLFKHLTNTNNSNYHTMKREIFLTVRKILSLQNQSDSVQLTQIQKEHIAEALSIISCNEIATRNNLTATASSSTQDDSEWICYQLNHLGPDLERIADGTADNRVRTFIPDKWQSDLFNIVDKRQSALIVAPTSSGKTYASYYCMESVLREGTDGIVVYVSPTKALVNQVAATVYARFKNTVMPPGKSVYGIFTRDFRTYATECQILITVPQCLELLLLSPRRYNWVKKLRYVIFDEVHCIAGNIGGVSWERSLTLIRCPFLALSATIRHPKQLHSWLQEMETFKQKRDIILKDQRPDESYKVCLIVHSERHSDLTKFDYTNNDFVHMHPYGNLEESVMKLHNGIPGHIFLSPKETYELYKAMNQVNSKSIEDNKLQLGTYFSINSKNGFITRNSVRDYETKLAALLTCWYRENFEDFCTTIELLKPDQSYEILEQNDFRYLMKNIVNLVEQLKQQNMLPAIIFSYNRHYICKMLKIVTEHLQQGDVTIDRRSQKKIDKKDKLKKKMEQKEKNAEKSDTNNKNRRVFTFKRGKLSLMNENANSLREKAALDPTVMSFLEERLYRISSRTNNLFIQALQHGVCMHHAGLNNKLRSAVEMLFRMKFLNVVFATGTLALGIHMPCKTTVIAGNSPYLNSLEYHQMSGRAGRRGYDTTGNVVFFGLNHRKQHTLLTAHLPSINGAFPLSITFVLRAILLIHDVTDKGKDAEQATNVAVSRVITLLENCLVYQQKPTLRAQIKHFFSFALQFLIMQDYINNKGVPLKWTGLVTHLHYHEPGNLAFIYLLKNGVIRKLCIEGKDDEEVQYQLVVLLCYLFTSIPVKKYMYAMEFKNSKVILDPLTDLFKNAVISYNDEVNFVFKQYFTSVAKYCTDQDNYLPLSNVKINAERYTEEFNENPGTVHRKFLNMCIPTIICSPFAALTGYNDSSNFYTKKNKINNIKRNICDDVNMIPIVNVNAELNAYALDFYRHGIINAIVGDNGLKAGEEFTRLQDFMLIIRTIKISLEEMVAIKGAKDPVYRHFTMLDSKYTELFRNAFPNYNY